MTALEFSALCAVLVPLITAVIVRASWSATAKGYVALGLSVAIGTAGAYFAGAFRPDAIAAFVLSAFGAAQVTYLTVFKPAGISCWIMEHIGNVDPRGVPE